MYFRAIRVGQPRRSSEIPVLPLSTVDMSTTKSFSDTIQVAACLFVAEGL